MINFKIGNTIDCLLKTEVNEVQIKGKVIFTNNIYSFNFSSITEQITSNILGRSSYNLKLDKDWEKFESLSNEINLKWGDICYKYNAKIAILKQCEEYKVVCLIYKKHDSSLFCCLNYTATNIFDISQQCFGGWFYPVSHTVQKFINFNLDENNRLQLSELYDKYKNADFHVLAKTEPENIIIFDVETNNFCENFIKYQKCNDKRFELYYPSVRVICCICIKDNSITEYSFDINNVKDFLKLLRSFDKVVSFNGIHFDFPVIQKQLGFKNPFKYKGIHFDILKELYLKTGKRFSLDLLARLNLGDKKMVKGRDMQSLNMDELTKACFSDVRQTYLIYRLLQSKSLMLPKVFGRNELEFPENYYQMPTSKSTACNFCKNDELYTIENLKYSENLENEKAYKLIVCMNCLTIRRDNNK